MSDLLVFSLALGIGVVAGLRSLAAPAVICWASRLGWLRLQGTPMAFMAADWALYLFSLLAVAELIGDKLPFVPSRTAPLGLGARILSGALSGASLGAAAGRSLGPGVVLGVLGALAGTFGGYQARVRLTKALPVPAWVVAVLEDVVAIGGGFFLCSRF